MKLKKDEKGINSDYIWNIYLTVFINGVKPFSSSSLMDCLAKLPGECGLPFGERWCRHHKYLTVADVIRIFHRNKTSIPSNYPTRD